MRNAESLAPPPLSFAAIIAGRGVCCYCGSASRTASLPVQLKALFGRALLNVARDPYLGALHVLLLPLAGLLMGTLFGDLTRLNEETAGVQVHGVGRGGGGVEESGFFFPLCFVLFVFNFFNFLIFCILYFVFCQNPLDLYPTGSVRLC